MPEKIRIYRERAATCAELAARAKAQDLKAHLLQLSKSWENLAIEAETKAKTAEGLRPIRG